MKIRVWRRKDAGKEFCRKQIGARGEQYAYEYLKKSGLEILERNWRCRHGEIDLVARDGRLIVFVEVKTRVEGEIAREQLFDSITRAKQDRLRRLSEIYLRLKYPGRVVPPLRIDVVGVLLRQDDYSLSGIDHLLAAI